jgi:acyl carrier protein
MDIRDTLLEIFKDLEFEAKGIVDSTNLREELGIDSTEFAEIAVAVEKKFSVVINDDEFNRAQTFGDVVNYVASAPSAR